MTKEEFFKLQERHDCAFRLKREADDLNALMESIQRAGIQLLAGANGYNLRNVLSPTLINKMQEMVIASLKDKHDDVVKQFNEL